MKILATILLSPLAILAGTMLSAWLLAKVIFVVFLCWAWRLSEYGVVVRRDIV